MTPARVQLRVAAVDQVGPYALVRVERDGVDPGVPGQLFMLSSGERLLPRPMSLCLAPPGELGFLIDPIGPGTRSLARSRPGATLGVTGPLGNGWRLDAEAPVLVGGGIGVAPLPYLARHLPQAPVLLGFRTALQAEAAALLPGAEVVLEPTLVTEPLAAHLDVEPGATPLACGPEPMLEAIARLAPQAQLAWEAPMACGYGACFGCVVHVDGVLVRLCVEGPVLDGTRVASPALRPVGVASCFS